jgi:hypothetical protein
MPAGGVNGVVFAVMSFAHAQRRDGEIVSISFVRPMEPDRYKRRRAPTSCKTNLKTGKALGLLAIADEVIE